MSIRKFFISQQKITGHHPKGLRSSTDNDYARFASMLRGRVDDFEEIGLRLEDMEAITLNLTLYLEDVISEAGIWRGFVEKMHQMYGKYLPFYDLDDDYLLDEPNLQDVTFIIWYTLLRHRGDHRGITNPETPGVMDMARALYPVLMEYFEKLPVNDDLREFFENAAFAEDFYTVREVMNWFYFDCYLTYSNDVHDWIEENMREISTLTGGDAHVAYYIAECAVPFSCKTGPLALKGGDWLGVVLRANGQEEKAKWTENVDYKSFELHLVKNYTQGDGGLIQSLDGEEFCVKEKNFMDFPESDANVCVASFVKYKEDWYLNGDSFSGNYQDSMLKKIQKEWNRLHSFEPNEKEISKLLKKSGGNPFFYFVDADELMFFLKRNFKHPELLLANFDDPDARELILCVVDNGKDVFILNCGASSFCDAHNFLYDKKEAKENGFEDALHLPASMLKYAMEHDMLPDVGLNSVYGEERGKQLFRENYDFIYRCVMGNEYIDR